MTRAPSENTESPGSTTTPAPSFPSIKGAAARGNSPDRMVWSSGVTPAAVIRTSTLPSARRGLGTSTSFSPPYPVNDFARIALIMISPFLPFATADVSRRHGNDRSAYAGSRFSGGDVGTLSQAATEGNVLARGRQEPDHEIIWRDVGSRYHAAVQGLQQAQSLLFGTAGD